MAPFEEPNFERTTIGAFEEKENIKVEKLSTRYKLSYQSKHITVDVSSGNKLSVHASTLCDYDNDGFVFKGSNPKTVKAIGELLLRASTLAE